MDIVKALKKIVLELVQQWRSAPAFASSPLSTPPVQRKAPPPRPRPRRQTARPAAARAPAAAKASAEPEAPAFDRARLRAAVLAVFNPSQPVENRVQLLGRQAELTQLMRVMMDLRSHAFVYGPRGAGKTSLMRAFGDYADEQGHLVIYLSCGGDCAFADLFAPYLSELLTAGLPPREQDEVRHLVDKLPEGFGARALAGVLASIADRDVIFIVDEYDRVTDAATRGEIATLLKLLSDFRARVQLLFVGIARDVGDLINSHPSLRRHLVAIPLRPFDGASMEDLFKRGMRATGMRFDDEARSLIASTAAGSPYHLRLFCFSAAIAAVDRDSMVIDRTAAMAGLRFALDLWSSTNSATASLFAQVAESGEVIRRDMEHFVRSRLAADGLQHAEAEPHRAAIDRAAFALLGPALSDRDEAGTHIFEDSLAPQFLLAACAVAAGQAHASDESAPRADMARRVI